MSRCEPFLFQDWRPDQSPRSITPNYGVAIFTLLASQLLGYGLAGLTRAFCVFPTYIVYPNLVPTVNLFDALHRDKDLGAQRKRLKLFWIVFLAIMCWEFIPEVSSSISLLRSRARC